MRIVSWNCGGYGYRGFNDNKAHVLFDKNEYGNDVDVLVIQEITLEECVDLDEAWKSRFWYGDGSDNSYRGVAIFSKKHKIEFTDEFDRRHRYIIPYNVTAETGKVFTVYAVWTKGPKYDTHVLCAMREYKTKRSLILIGDFNTFAKKENDGLAKLTSELAPLKNCAEFNGKASTPTFASQKFGEGTDDFCFASADITITDFRIGDHGGLSDHRPITVDFKL
jgi:exonuclease III